MKFSTKFLIANRTLKCLPCSSLYIFNIRAHKLCQLDEKYWQLDCYHVIDRETNL